MIQKVGEGREEKEMNIQNLFSLRNESKVETTIQLGNESKTSHKEKEAVLIVINNITN